MPIKQARMVKHIANLPGAMMMTGRNRENATMRKKRPLPRKAAKYAS